MTTAEILQKVSFFFRQINKDNEAELNRVATIVTLNTHMPQVQVSLRSNKIPIRTSSNITDLYILSHDVDLAQGRLDRIYISKPGFTNAIDFPRQLPIKGFDNCLKKLVSKKIIPIQKTPDTTPTLVTFLTDKEVLLFVSAVVCVLGAIILFEMKT